MIKVIAFDKDGTLTDLEDVWNEPTVQLMAQLFNRVQLTPQEKVLLAEEMGLHDGRVVANSLLAAGSLGEISQFLAEKTGLLQDEIEQFAENYFLEYIESHPETLTLIPHAKQVVEQLSNDYQLAIITNDNRRLTEAILRLVGLSDYFTFVGCADEYGAKPDTGALIALCEQLQVTPDEIVYVGDSKVDVVYGRYMNSMIGLAVDETHVEHLAGADYIIRSLDELVPIIRILDKEMK